MKTQDQASTTTEADAVVIQDAQVAPKTAASTKAASPKKVAPKAKAGEKAAIKKLGSKSTQKPAAEKVSAAGRAASKKAQVLDMLRAKSGATPDQILAATGWQHHTCRGLLSVAGKTMKLTSEKTDAGRVYRIAK